MIKLAFWNRRALGKDYCIYSFMIIIYLRRLHCIFSTVKNKQTNNPRCLHPKRKARKKMF